MSRTVRLPAGIFSISEPYWSSEEDSKKIKEPKRRVHDLYAKYKPTKVSLRLL
jgi:hypothetical protein